ncbi:MAG: hypothetical protein JSS82_14090 [Bacteroidetes bacterium]|nr:hypothetical protein [Bacteroidota bacterium]
MKKIFLIAVLFFTATITYSQNTDSLLTLIFKEKQILHALAVITVSITSYPM